jgi:hydrogenase maturation protein HypF
MAAPSCLDEGRGLRVRGVVQGVGFRPFVWHLARELGLRGEVSNDGEGVLIAAWGVPHALDALTRRLAEEAPPLAHVTSVEPLPLPEGRAAPEAFRIVHSGTEGQGALIPPDAATCPACLAEVHDPAQRRRHHPFANCTHCGPRLTIAHGMPWDRAQTSMAAFPLCPDCAAEYADPADRRFHAQPIACPACGPRLWIEDARGHEIPGAPLAHAAKMLREGAVLAIKGLGGFHLACDAAHGAAVAALRAGKARDAKPFALMANLDQARAWCAVSPEAEALLAGPAAPIVLLPRRAGVVVPEALAPGQDHLGVMLPATPLHHLLLEAFGGPLVMTSGNRGGEPQVIDNDAARERLGGLAQGFVMHDRAIVNRLDDSVLALDEEGQVMPLRRARGYVPSAIPLPFADLPPTLAMGGELKASFALIRGSEAIVGPHVGDLEQAAVLGDYRGMLALYRQIFAFTPEVIAVDAHAGYLYPAWRSNGGGMWRAAGARGPSPCPHGRLHGRQWCAGGDEPVLGLLLDGLGLGDDGALWGGEVLVGGYRHAQRVDGLAAVPLIGGSAAMREPWRNLLAQLVHAFGPDWRAHAGPVMAHLPPDADQADPRLRLAEAMIAGAPIARPVRLPGDCSRRWPPRWAFMPRARRSKGRRPWRSKPSRGHSWRAKRPIGRNPRSCPGAWGPICGALFWPTARQASRRGALLPAFTSPSPMRWRTVWPNRGGRGSASRSRAG